MNETLTLALAWLAGGSLGAIFFGGLWWTICKGVSSPHPARWFLASGLLRMAVVVAGFYFIGDGQWKRLVACLVGFIGARLVVTWLTRAPVKTIDHPTPEGGHAP